MEWLFLILAGLVAVYLLVVLGFRLLLRQPTYTTNRLDPTDHAD